MAYIGRRAGGDVWRRGTEVAAGTGGQTQYAERAMAVLGSKFKVGTYFRKGVARKQTDDHFFTSSSICLASCVKYTSCTVLVCVVCGSLAS